MTPARLTMQFESLGDNCEFGLVQRYAGAEPLSLFRFSFEHMTDLLAALGSRFRALKEPDAVEIFLAPENREYMVRLKPHRFVYHTHINAGAVSPDVLRGKEVQRVNFLVDKLIADLKNAEKILIRKGEGTETEADAIRLLEATRRYGPNTLLWVMPANADHPPGTVEVVRPHLLRGYVGRFAPYDDAHNIELPDWLDVCASAYQLWKTDAPVGARAGRPAGKPMVNLIDDAATFAGAGWRNQRGGATAVSPPPQRDDAVVLTHVLNSKTDFLSGLVWAKFIDDGIQADEIYTLSASLFVPSSFRGTSAGMVFDALPSLSVRNADLLIRDRWQQVSVSTRIPKGVNVANPGLLLVGEAGDFVYSTCWKLEAGVVPTGS
jgi:hypothetical protein